MNKDDNYFPFDYGYVLLENGVINIVLDRDTIKEIAKDLPKFIARETQRWLNVFGNHYDVDMRIE